MPGRAGAERGECCLYAGGSGGEQGLFVIAAPYLLGSLADHRGLHAAFTVELVLITLAALLLLAGLATSRR